MLFIPLDIAILDAIHGGHSPAKFPVLLAVLYEFQGSIYWVQGNDLSNLIGVHHRCPLDFPFFVSHVLIVPARQNSTITTVGGIVGFKEPFFRRQLFCCGVPSRGIILLLRAAASYSRGVVFGFRQPLALLCHKLLLLVSPLVAANFQHFIYFYKA